MILSLFAWITWSVTLREEQILRESENKVLRRIFDLKRGSNRRMEESA
jgi:hypothetical protein